MIIRESGLANGIGWCIAAWAWFYATDLLLRADDVTSRQWQYLLSVPGHRWSWVAVFGGGALLLTIGMLGRWYKLRAAVQEFQRRVGLDPDGVVGPLTWTQLNKYGVKL